MVQAAPIAASSLAQWRARAVAPAPVLAQALEACAGHAGNEAECVDVLDLLAMLGCDAQTQAAALWFELARSKPETWAGIEPPLPPELQSTITFAAE